MRRIPVRSTTIAAIGYLPATRELEINFRATGDVYRYFDVPDKEYVAFMEAESKGTYLNQAPVSYLHANKAFDPMLRMVSGRVCG